MMKGNAFELRVADLLRQKGYRVEHNAKISGSQTDAVAFSDNESILVECKDWQTGAGLPIARDLSGRVQEARLGGDPRMQFATGLLVSVVSASNGARQHAQTVGYIRCVTVAELETLAVPLFDEVLEVFRPYLRRLVFEYEHWPEYNEEGPTGPQPRQCMMIPKMALCDLRRCYIPLCCRPSKHYGVSGLASQEALSARNQFMLQLYNLGWSVSTGSHAGMVLRNGSVDTLLHHWYDTPQDQGAPQFLVLLGDYGTGKSSALLHFGCELGHRIAKGGHPHPIIPLYIDLQEFRRIGRIEDFLRELLARSYSLEISAARIDRLLRSRRLIVLFDGFDEMGSRGSIHDTLDNFRELKRIAKAGVKTLLAARTHYFRSLKETEQVIRERLLSSDNPLLTDIQGDADFEIVEIEEFSESQVEQLVTLRCGPEKAKTVCEFIRAKYDLQELSHRPVLLDMMLKTLPLLVPTHPILNAAMLYDAYTSLWLDHDDWRSNVTPQGKREIMCRLAWEVVKQGAVTLNLDRALTLLDASPQWLKSQATNALIAAERLDYDLRTCTFLRRNSSGQYFFSHRSFQEYFCARYLVENLSDEQPELASHRLADYGTYIRWTWPSYEIVNFVLELIATEPSLRGVLLGLTKRNVGFGGNGLTLVAEAYVGIKPEEFLGPNLRATAAFALNLTGRNLRGTDLSGSALASPLLVDADMCATGWHDAACRTNHVYALRFVQGNLLIGLSNSTLTHWNIQTRENCGYFANKSQHVHGMAIHPSGNQYASSTWNDHILVLDARNGDTLSDVYADGAGGGKIVYSVDGSFLAASSWDGVVSVWDSASPAKLVRRWDTLRRVTDLCFRHDNTTLAAATDGQVLLLDVASGNCRAIKGPDPHESRSLEPVAFSSSRLLACGDYSVEIFDIEDGTLLKKVGGPGLSGSEVFAFSPDSSLLAAGGRDGVAILDLATGSWRQFGQYEEGGGPYEEGRWARVHSVAFSPDGTLLVSGDGNGIAHFWRISDGKRIGVIDCGIYCRGADVTNADFGNRSIRMKPEWEVWWSGPALKERMLRCGAVDNGIQAPKWYGVGESQCWWDSEEYSHWWRSIHWVMDSVGQTTKASEDLARLFSGVASFHVYGGGPQKHAPKDRRS